MPIEMICECNKCKDQLEYGDDVFCSFCFGELKGEIAFLREEVASLKRELENK
ncbi:MAG: hypothetical protein QME51_06470 [Planctomycetota bacterium]|nr:hypothetical protein [Planctomycetota bacterium]